MIENSEKSINYTMGNDIADQRKSTEKLHQIEWKC